MGKRLAAGAGFVAEARERMLGCVLTTFNVPGELYVGRLAVIPEWRRRGLGRRLMMQAEAFARERGCRAMALGVRIAFTENIALFERLGFPWSSMAVIRVVPRALRDRLYGVLARNRLRWFGSREACFVPEPSDADRFIG